MREENWGFVVLAEAIEARMHVLTRLLAAFGTPEALLEAGPAATKAQVPGISGTCVERLFSPELWEKAKEIAYFCGERGIALLTYGSDAYPKGLLEIDNPPPLLYCVGRAPLPDDDRAVAIVGSRHMDEYGQEMAYKISYDLTAAGVKVVSGMAVGIDGVATAAALAAGGAPIGVLGCGIDVIYPAEHALLRDVMERGGTLLSEYAPGTEPRRFFFPRRNRIIAALARGVLVVEAGERSGSLVTARTAEHYGRPVLTVPRPAFEEKGNFANLEGAFTPVRSARDVMDVLSLEKKKSAIKREGERVYPPADAVLATYGVRAARVRETRKREEAPRKSAMAPSRVAAPMPSALAALSPEQRNIYLHLPKGPFTAEELVLRGVGVAEASLALLEMEMHGLVEVLPGGRYQKQ